MTARSLTFFIRRTKTGFLLNHYNPDGLWQRLDCAGSCQAALLLVRTTTLIPRPPSTLPFSASAGARSSAIHPLQMTATDIHGREHEAMAINEVAIFRQSRQVAHVRVSVNQRVRIPCLMCDGIMVATPAGSTAYNQSAYGPVLPLEAGLLALTPISPFRPRGWRGALLPNSARVRFECIDPLKRPMTATADSRCEVHDVKSVDIHEDVTRVVHILCDSDHTLDERISNEQFVFHPY